MSRRMFDGFGTPAGGFGEGLAPDRFLDRWNAWAPVCDLAPMKKLAKTIMARSEGILRSIATGLSNGVLEAINGNVQAAKRKAKGYPTKRNLKAIVYLITDGVLANSPT
jgi:transposase